MATSPEVLAVVGIGGAVGGGLLYHFWNRRRQRLRQAAVDAERWRRLKYLLEVLDDVFAEFESEMRPGVTPVALASFLEDAAHRRGVRSSVRNFRAFPAAACVSVNDVFVNGLPTHEPVVAGDLLNVQFGVTDGLAYAHQAWAYSVGDPTAEQTRLLEAGVEALTAATRTAKGTGRVGDVSEAIQRAADAHGCTPSHDFVGCGIWERPFESPQIPCYMPSEHANVPLHAGMVLLVQAIFHSGQPDSEVLEDQWSVHSADGKPAVTMSRMLLLKEDGAVPLTELRETRITNSARGSDEVA